MATCYLATSMHAPLYVSSVCRCCCCIAYQGRLYVFGGESEKISKKHVRGKKEISKRTLCFDPKEEKWRHLAEMPVARALAGCMIFQNKIYLIGEFLFVAIFG